LWGISEEIKSERRLLNFNTYWLTNWHEWFCFAVLIANSRFIIMYRQLYGVLFVGSTGVALLKLLFQVLERVAVAPPPNTLCLWGTQEFLPL
jgi:hypothetical protein